MPLDAENGKRRPFMVIEIEGCDFRISGSDTDWQVQYPWTDKKGEVQWKGRYFFPSLDFAIAKAYELALRESPAKVDIKQASAECAKVKDALIRAVRKAVA